MIHLINASRLDALFVDPPPVERRGRQVHGRPYESFKRGAHTGVCRGLAGLDHDVARVGSRGWKLQEFLLLLRSLLKLLLGFLRQLLPRGWLPLGYGGEPVHGPREVVSEHRANRNLRTAP